MNYVWPDRLTPMALLHIPDSLRPWLATNAYVDRMDLFDLATGQKGVPVDKLQRLGVLAIREERRPGRLRRLGHLTTHYMLADVLTKAHRLRFQVTTPDVDFRSLDHSRSCPCSF